jgi:hypothetical protein
MASAAMPIVAIAVPTRPCHSWLRDRSAGAGRLLLRARQVIRQQASLGRRDHIPPNEHIRRAGMERAPLRRRNEREDRSRDERRRELESARLRGRFSQHPPVDQFHECSLGLIRRNFRHFLDDDWLGRTIENGHRPRDRYGRRRQAIQSRFHTIANGGR